MAAPKSTAIYSRPGCPFCTKIKEVYRMKGWSFSEFVLNVNFTRQQFYAEFGNGATFPQVIINGQKMGGATETVKYLRESKLL
jgi:glutaredoxin